ncbi:MAG: M16 family metallopeptidase [Candidatus Longimicrobiales bacterium M2_2A_002]
MNGHDLLDRIRPVEHRLDNGLRLLVREDHSAPVVAIVTHVRAGYFDEPDRLVGISHVLEHMYFKGTERRGVGEIARQTKAAGGYLNAGTIYDHTSYYTVLPSSAVDMGLDIQADALINSQIDEAELTKELLVIIQEVNRKLDTPSALASEKLYETMFDVHPMRRWRMGTEGALQRLEREDVMDYYRAMYRGGNITLVVSGDVDPDRVVDRVEELYGPVPPGAPDRPERSEPERSDARFREMTGDIGRSYGEAGWRTPGTLHADTPALDVAAAVLGEGRASRLYRAVRERGLASRIDAYNYTPTEIGVFGLSLESEPDATADALRAAWAEVDAVRADGVEPEELERVRTVMQARVLRRLETAQGQANLLAEWEALGDWREAGAYLEAVRTLEPGDVRDAVRRHLDPDAITVLAYRPEGTPALGWDDALPAAIQGTDRRTRPLPERGSEPGPEPAGETAVPAPLTVGRRSVEDGVVRFDLGGGRLVVKPRSRSPLVSMAISRKGGTLHESLETAGITGLMMRSSVKGTATRSAARIALDSEGLGGSISASSGSDLLSWSLTVPSEHFGRGFSLLSDVALRASFPGAEVERERDVLLADLRSLRDDMYRYPLRLLYRAAFGEHPYGYGPDDVEAALGGVDADALRRWHAQELADPWVFVVGDVDPDRVAGTIAEAMGTPARSLEPRAPSPEWPRSPEHPVVRRARAQTALAIAFPGPARNDRDRITLRVLANAISGLGNRLFEELRSRRSLAYTVTAYPVTRGRGGAFVGYIATAPERETEARDTLIEELLGLREEPPAEDVLERARRYTIGGWQIRTQTNGARLAELAGALMLGEGLEEIRTFEDRVRAVSRDDVAEAARRWFDPDRLVQATVRGEGPADGD